MNWQPGFSPTSLPVARPLLFWNEAPRLFIPRVKKTKRFRSCQLQEDRGGKGCDYSLKAPTRFNRGRLVPGGAGAPLPRDLARSRMQYPRPSQQKRIRRPSRNCVRRSMTSGGTSTSSRSASSRKKRRAPGTGCSFYGDFRVRYAYEYWKLPAQSNFPTFTELVKLGNPGMRSGPSRRSSASCSTTSSRSDPGTPSPWRTTRAFSFVFA